MGWWKTSDPKTGKPDMVQNKNDLMIGDEAADRMGDCLDTINAIYEKGLGRSPQKDEVYALFNFVAKARGYKNLPADGE